MSLQQALENLVSIAEALKSGTLHAVDSNRMRLWNKARGEDAVRGLQPIWSRVSDRSFIPTWESWTLRALQSFVGDSPSRFDGEAAATTLMCKFGEDREVVDFWSERIGASDMTELQLVEFYAGQAENWARLLNKVAAKLGATPDAIVNQDWLDLRASEAAEKLDIKSSTLSEWAKSPKHPFVTRTRRGWYRIKASRIPQK